MKEDSEPHGRRYTAWTFGVLLTLIVTYFVAYHFTASRSLQPLRRGGSPGYVRAYSFPLSHQIFVPAGWLEARLWQRYVILRTLDPTGRMVRATVINPRGRSGLTINHFD